MRSRQLAMVIGGGNKTESNLIGVRVPKPQLDKFKKLCEREGVTLSVGIRNLIKWAVEQES